MWLGSWVAVAVVEPSSPIRPPAWELPYAMGAALESKKKKKKKKKKIEISQALPNKLTPSATKA